MNFKDSDLKELKERYHCTIEKYLEGGLTDGMLLSFTFDSSAGDIAKLLAENEISFVYELGTIELSGESLKKLLTEVNELWM